MEKLKEIANGYRELFMSGSQKGNPYYFMMYKTLENLIKEIENVDNLEIEENKDLSL